MQGLRSSVVAFALVSLSVAAVACSTTVLPDNGSSSGQNPSNPGDPKNPGTNTDGGTPPSDASTTDPQAPATNAAVVKIDGTCPAANPCGGNPSGTWDYTSGCIGDVFEQARNACPGLDTTQAKVTVKGSLFFTGTNALKRNATVTISGSIKFPQSCTQGQCAAIEDGLKGSFDTVSCTGSTDCTCTVSDTDSETDGTTYSVAGNTITTADGETYDFCINGSSFEYKGKSAGSEEGIWTLKKR